MSEHVAPSFRETKAALIAQAKRILERQEPASAEAKFALAQQLSAVKEYGYARRLLARARRAISTDPVTRVKFRQHYARYTYKDWNIPLDARLDRALEILSEDENLATTHNQETLGIVGDIYQQRWEAKGEKHYLERALGYYLRGYEEGPAYDFGYTGSRAAFALDLLASIEAPAWEETAAATAAEASSAHVTQMRRAQARAIRQKLASVLPEELARDENSWLRKEWWIYANLAEAYFGLAKYDEARHWLEQMKGLQIADWQYEAVARQLSRLARLQGEGSLALRQSGDDAPAEQTVGIAWSVIGDFLGDAASGINSFAIGKVGLALAGGGFRAALFHIGVLARLAELDVLRHIEVISCSSGGSIIGAHYYLEVRKLLESKADAEITRADYIALVQRLERDFMAGVQRNIRMRYAAGLMAGLKAIFRRNYSRTEHLGVLLEREFFARIEDGGEKAERYLSNLYICPYGARPNFSPRLHNWRRATKVPALILNATALNTGHNWQFTASWMGETPASINTETDANECLRPMYYAEAPPPYQRMRLGRAVAASACLPGLFEPIAFTDLYPERIVRLTDGSAHGSQGVTALVENGCDVLLVCDASGESETQAQPGSGLLEVPRRTANLLLARARAAQYDNLKALQLGKVVRGLMYVHLMKGLDNEPVGWIGCSEPRELEEDALPASQRGPLTRYGIRKDMQASLAAIRSDLDSFSDVEAFALMTCGYRMAEHEFASCIEDFPAPHPLAPRPPWRFLAVEEPLKRSGSIESISGTAKLLKVASNRGFKVWRLSPLAQGIAMFLGLLTTSALFYLALRFPRTVIMTNLTVGKLLALIVAVCLILLLGKLLQVWRNIPKTLTEVFLDVGLLLSGFLAARIYLWVIDRFYLKAGAVAAPPPPPTAEEAVKPTSAFTQPIAALQNVGNIIQQSRPVQSVARRLDSSDPTTNRFADRNLIVEALSRLLEAGGYEAIRFPRTHALNPLRINLDLVARKDKHYICIEVKKSDESAELLDWKCALELEVAAQALKAMSGRQPQDKPEQASQPPIVDARLVLVDTAPDATLKDFTAEHGVSLISYTSEEVARIYDLANKYLQVTGAEPDGKHGYEENSYERDRLWNELRLLLEPWTTGKEAHAQGQQRLASAS